MDDDDDTSKYIRKNHDCPVFNQHVYSCIPSTKEENPNYNNDKTTTVSSFKSNENMHKNEDGSYFIVLAKLALTCFMLARKA